MSRNFTTCRPRFRARLGVGLLAGLLGFAMLPSLTSAQSLEAKREQVRIRNSQFNLAAGPTTVLRINQFQCGLTNNGDSCTDVFDSPTGGGGFWPTGSPNQYMFNSGLQVTGIIPKDDACTNRAASNTPTCFHWSGDTTGAFFFDASGNRKHATAITQLYSSLDPQDLATWPAPGSIPDFPEATTSIINDTSLFNGVLIGRQAASQQDTWVAYWDGDPVRSGGSTGRPHPMGILVEQRSLAWNYPEGNEAVIYFIYKFTNVTNNLLFQRLNENRFFGGLDSLPNEGWRFDSIYVAYDSDPDVGDAGSNYASGILPFNMSIAYIADMQEPSFIYPPDIFHAPFFPRAPGIIGMKYLKSPVDPATGQEVGLTSLSQHTVGAPFPDPSSVQRGWRYISLNVDPNKSDSACTFPLAEIKARKACFLSQTPADVRVFIGSGPFSLEPGQSATIAVAMFAAATVATPLINSGPGQDNAPGVPSTTPGCGPNPIRPIEVGAGWVSTDVCPADPADGVNQFDVTVVPNSLLGKALVAQSIFDNKFLLGFAPEPPNFFLVPGDNRVTVVWEPSATETVRPGGGDPFFVASGDPDNALYDPNYRQYDVEGYRIYRGTSPATMRLIAQFDYAGTELVDVLCITDPEHVTGTPCTDTNVVPLTGDVVQYRTIAQLANGDPIVLSADTALAAEQRNGTAQPLTDTGVPFAFVDTQVRNGFQYFYEVTAFDINSMPSGPTSLESAGGTKTVQPQRAASSLTSADFSLGIFGRGTQLATCTSGAGCSTDRPAPTIDPATGTFSGPAQPTTNISLTFEAYAAQLLQAGAKLITIDSIVPEIYLNGHIGTYYMSVDGQTTTALFDDLYRISATNTVREQTLPGPSFQMQSDPAVRADLIARGVDAPPTAGLGSSTITVELPHWHSGWADWIYKQPGFVEDDLPTTNFVGGSRWFDGANETMADPTENVISFGALTGITAIFKPAPYLGTVSPAGETRSTAPTGRMANYTGLGGTTFDSDLFRRFYFSTGALSRAADVKIFWGAAGVDSIIDVTHNVPVQFSPTLRATYGFLTDADGNGVLNYGDFYYIPGLNISGNGIQTFAQNFPTNLVQQPVALNTDTQGNLGGDGTGFGLYINGEAWLFNGAVPTNTVWTLRTYNGSVAKSGAGVYSFSPRDRNPAVPGLTFGVNVNSAAQIVAANADLTKVHTVPDPYYAVSLYDLGPANKELQFVNLPAQATVRIYSLSGVLVDVINHNDPAGGGKAVWDLRNRSNQFVASGVYMFHVSTPEGKSHIGKFTVINSGLGN